MAPSPRLVRRLACALVACLAAAPALAQSIDNKGKDFLMAFLPNYSGVPTLQLHLTGDVATDVTVEYPAVSPTFTQTVAISPGSVTIVDIPANAASSWASDTVSANTVHASAAQEFVAYMINLQPYTSDAALALPIDALNTEYRVMNWSTSDGEFAVFAAFDNTNVTITPTATFGSHAAGTPFTVNLNRGQGYFAANADFSGTQISADRPVGLSNGNRCTNIVRGACDHIFEVSQPVQTWGTSIPVANLPSRALGSIYRIVASADATTVSQDGVALSPVLNKGQVLQTGELDGSHVFTSNQPIFVAQFMTGSPSGSATDGDPAMGNMIPSAQYGSHYTFATLSQTQFPAQFLTVIADSRDTATISLDGSAIGASNFTAIGTSGFSSALLTLAAGTHNIQSTHPHGITVEGFGNYDSYLYPGGAQIAFINPVGDANPPICTLAPIEGNLFGGSATDDRPSEDKNGNGQLDAGEDLNGNQKIDKDTGIFSVQLVDGAQNLTLTVSPFVPGDPRATFQVAPTNPQVEFSGSVRVSDGAGNTCERAVGLEVPSIGFDDWGEDVEVEVGLDSHEDEFRRAYVALQSAGVKILDVTDPHAITTLGTYDPGTCKNGSSDVDFFADDVELLASRSVLFVAAGRCGIIVLDVSNPAAPVEIGRYDTPVWAEALALDDQESSVMGYIADHNGGLVIVDFTATVGPSHGAPVRRSTLGSSTAGWGTGAAIDVALRHDETRLLAFVAATQGLRVVDVSTPTSPRLIGKYDTAPSGTPPEVPQDVTLADRGNVALIGAWQAGLLAIDVSDPTNPQLLDRETTTEGNAYYESEESPDGTIYAAEGKLGLRSFQLDDGEFFALDDGVGVPIAGGSGWAWDVQAKDGFVYVTYGILETGTGGLAILEVAPQIDLRGSGGPDSDGDGTPDSDDNCAGLANASQTDSDADGFGNACDFDYDGDGVVGGLDFLRLHAAFGTSVGHPGYDPIFDWDADGSIGGSEYVMFRAHLGSAPGPSGLACAGVVPCP